MLEGAPVWVLLGHRTGDNNQLLRLANEVGLPFRTIALGYNRLRSLPAGLLGATLASLDRRSRSQIAPPWPRLVLGIGNRSVAAALAIRKMSGGATKLVRLGNPRVSPAKFDLVITTAQYAVPEAPNVLRLPAGISTAPPLEPTREESAWLEKLSRPHRLLLIGGDTFMWSLPAAKLAHAAAFLGNRGPGSVIAVASARTPADVRDAVASGLRGRERGLVWGKFPRYPVLLHDADEIYVTADSVAMISDAIATGKPVGLIEPEMTTVGRLLYTSTKAGGRVPVRDVRRFWNSVRCLGLAGPVEQPHAGKLCEYPLVAAVSAVRALLES